nr:MAG TPA: hypothetical protein [Caudoviricetes sp.]
MFHIVAYYPNFTDPLNDPLRKVVFQGITKILKKL